VIKYYIESALLNIEISKIKHSKVQCTGADSDHVKFNKFKLSN